MVERNREQGGLKAIFGSCFKVLQGTSGRGILCSAFCMIHTSRNCEDILFQGLEIYVQTQMHTNISRQQVYIGFSYHLLIQIKNPYLGIQDPFNCHLVDSPFMPPGLSLLLIAWEKPDE